MEPPSFGVCLPPERKIKLTIAARGDAKSEALVDPEPETAVHAPDHDPGGSEEASPEISCSSGS
jgi:hypothetical protein